MKRILHVKRNRNIPEFWDYRATWLLKEHKNSWRIWGFKTPLSKLILKDSKIERISEL